MSNTTTTTRDATLVVASLTGHILGSLLKVWLLFWSIDQLFNYHIDFTGWNFLAGYLLTGIFHPRSTISVRYTGATK